MGRVAEGASGISSVFCWAAAAKLPAIHKTAAVTSTKLVFMRIPFVFLILPDCLAAGNFQTWRHERLKKLKLSEPGNLSSGKQATAVFRVFHQFRCPFFPVRCI